MAGELLVLKKDSNTYYLSEVARTYSRGHYLAGSVSRAITGKLNVRKRAYKTMHTVNWEMLTYDTAPDGGLGLKDLEALVYSGDVFTLEVNRYPVSGDPVESFSVMFDPESFEYELVKLRGHGRRVWRVSVTLLEV